MKQYQDLVRLCLNGVEKGDRTGTGTRSIFGHQMRFDLSEGFPLVTTKKTHFKSVIAELLWFLSGSTKGKDLEAMGCTIWKEWSRPWTRDREVVEVKRVVKGYVPYSYGLHKVPRKFDNEVDTKLYATWQRMMSRCYDETAHNFRFYGGKGVSVSESWHNPFVFINEAKTIPHWAYKASRWNDFELDKDYFGANQYGVDTCIWLHKEENKPLDWFKVTSPNGDVFLFDGATEGSESLGISRTSLHRFCKYGVTDCLKGNNRKFKGWSFECVNNDGDTLTRRALIEDGDVGPMYSKQWRDWGGVDQIATLVDGLRKDPDSRRHIVSAWNPDDIPDMALAPCHAMFQCYVAEGRLSLQVYQRSADVFLGVPFNIASYAALTMMLAQQCGYELGELIWTGGDCHLYSNHIEQARELLSRCPHSSPDLRINKAPDIFSYKPEDFALDFYFHHPAIPAPVAV